MKRMLIAMLLVLILALLLIVTAMPKLGHGKHPQLAGTRSCIGSIEHAIEEYRTQTGNYPPVDQGLTVLQPRVIARIPYDAWGNPFTYRLIRGKPEIRSAGPDGQFDTADDLTN